MKTEIDPADTFDGGYHIFAKEKHKARVNKNSDRIEYAIKQLKKHNIEYEIKNYSTGHFHCRCKADDSLVQFYAGTGKIMGKSVRGIHNLIKICDGEL